jgi:glycosyltransferase involved in cell wall biosynthesis
MLVAIETHPVQYHAPVYRALEQRFGVRVTSVYGSDFSVAGYRDPEFGAFFKWDTDLLSGYSSVFLSRVSAGGPGTAGAVSTRGLRAVLASLKPSAVLVLGYSPRFHRVSWFEARRTGAPILFRGETSDVAVDRDWVKARARDAALRVAYRTCSRLLYIGQRSYEHFARLGVVDSRLVFSPYCVDVTPFECDESARDGARPAMRREWRVSDRDVVVLFSGKFSERKGVDLVLPAVRALPVAVRDRIVVVFLGDGEQRGALAASAAGAPAVRVIFPGFQNQTQLSRFYHGADVLVLPSRHSETWGLVVNEALHHGLPCVVSDRVGSAPDLVAPGVTGAVCTPGSSDALRAALEQVMPLIGRSSVRDACRTRVHAYTVDKAAEGIAAAYAAAIDLRRLAGKA